MGQMGWPYDSLDCLMLVYLESVEVLVSLARWNPQVILPCGGQW